MKSILIVEDENLIASSIKSILRNLGYLKTYISGSGVNALKIIEEKHPDLILADIILEGKMSGIELAQQVKKKYSIPVIFVTAYSDEGTVNKAKLAEPYGYITKPIQQKDLKIAVDIAFYKFKMDKKLQENEAKLKTILHTMPSGLFTIDLNKKITTWNKEAETITGLKAKDTIGKLCSEILDCEECKKGCLLFDDDVDKPICNKESVLHINERKIALLKNEDILKDLDGNNIGGIVGFIDITERKQAEEELYASHQVIEGVINSIPVRVFWKDRNLIYLGGNKIFAKDAGFSDPKDLIGKDDYQMGWRDQAELYQSDDRQIIESGRSKIFIEEPQTTPEGKRIDLLTSKVPMHDSNGEIIGVIGAYMDITERKISEEKLKNAYTELENTQQELIQSQTLAALGGFASGIAHEIRNPLANISASAQYCINKFDLASKIKSYLRIIIRNSNKANKIIKDLLDFARPSEFVFKQENILRSLNRACDLTKAKRFNNNIRLYKRCSRVLPKILIDAKRMEQVFLNIIINSIDSMSKGGRLSITAYSEKEYVVINISDTGKGISTQDISKIFNPFFTKKPNGVGLGLSVTHRIIKSHKGIIEVESEYRKGTEIIIRLPIVNDKK